MKKLTKRFATMGAAVMIMASVSAVVASARETTFAGYSASSYASVNSTSGWVTTTFGAPSNSGFNIYSKVVYSYIENNTIKYKTSDENGYNSNAVTAYAYAPSGCKSYSAKGEGSISYNGSTVRITADEVRY